MAVTGLYRLAAVRDDPHYTMVARAVALNGLKAEIRGLADGDLPLVISSCESYQPC
jgi:hypothetical protein